MFSAVPAAHPASAEAWGAAAMVPVSAVTTAEAVLPRTTYGAGETAFSSSLQVIKQRGLVGHDSRPGPRWDVHSKTITVLLNIQATCFSTWFAMRTLGARPCDRLKRQG